MARDSTFDITDQTPHAQATSANTTDTKTLTAPRAAQAALISVLTTSARVTFDGTTPSSTNGIIFPAAIAPVVVPLSRSIKFNSTAAANSIVDVLWLS